MSKISEFDIIRAATQLSRSEKGRGAMLGLLQLLDGDGLGLDVENQQALLVLLRGAWHGYALTTRTIMRSSLGTRGGAPTDFARN